jgi:dUTP pyrophosphatase
MVLEGLIDPNYTGPLSVVVFNPTLVPKIIKKGDRLAQLVIIPIESREIKIVDEMPETSRNAKGFGHSGR